MKHENKLICIGFSIANMIDFKLVNQPTIVKKKVKFSRQFNVITLIVSRFPFKFTDIKNTHKNVDCRISQIH